MSKNLLIFFLSFLAFANSHPLKDADVLEIKHFLRSFYAEILSPLFRGLAPHYNDSPPLKCALCQNILDATRKLILTKYNRTSLYKTLDILCSVAIDAKTCDSMLHDYFDIVFENVFERLANPQYFCHLVGFCAEGVKTEDTYDYANAVLKNKPAVIRERVDRRSKRVRMLQITDVHLDKDYRENSTIFCDNFCCCHEAAPEYARVKSTKYGAVAKCDASQALVESFFRKARALKPDFVIWTGDNTAHFLVGGQEIIYNATKYLVKLAKETFNDIPIYFALGNHEKYPNNIFSKNESEFLERMADLYADYFPDEEALESFRKFGYYTTLHSNETNLRIVVLNSFLCSTFNFHLYKGDYSQARDEFKWLYNVLLRAEKNREVVYILDHTPVNSNFYLTECALRMSAIFERFTNIIRGFFSGHTHQDDIVAVRGYFEPRPVVGINYVCPPLTTFPDVNPSLRMYVLDGKTWNVVDYEQYRFIIGNPNSTWTLSHRATELFKVPDLTYWDKMFYTNVEGEYILKRNADSDEGRKYMHDKDSVKFCKCLVQYDNHRDFNQCLEKLTFESAVDLLEKFLGEWPLEYKPVNITQ